MAGGISRAAVVSVGRSARGDSQSPTSTGINGLPSQRSPEELHNTRQGSKVSDDTTEEAWGKLLD